MFFKLGISCGLPVPAILNYMFSVVKKNKYINKNNKNQPIFMSNQEVSFTLSSSVP